MPTSHPKIISPICEKIMNLKPCRVLDVGVGYGKWGALTREYTDIWAWRFYSEEWVIVIDGIEIHERYRSPNWGHYDQVFIGHAVEVLPKLFRYELIIAMEILEHFTKEDGLKFLNEVFNHIDQMIISYSNIPQKNVRDNPAEDHLSTWSVSELEQFGKIEVLNQDDVSAVLFITKR